MRNGGVTFKVVSQNFCRKSSSDEGQRIMADVVCPERSHHPSSQMKEKAVRREKELSPPRAPGLSSTISRLLRCNLRCLQTWNQLLRDLDFQVFIFIQVTGAVSRLTWTKA